MNKPRKPFSLEEGKIQATILLKSVRSEDSKLANQAAKRFQRLSPFSALSIPEILLADLKRKHALNVIAIEQGFQSWTALKSEIHFIIGGHLNNWFATYDAAKAWQKVNGGFLFPYKNQFFICSADYVGELGFDPDNPLWKLIDYDWAKPVDVSARDELNRIWLMDKSRGNQK